MHIHPLIIKYGSVNSSNELFDVLWNDIQEAILGDAVNQYSHSEKEYLVGFKYTESCTYDKLWDKFPVSMFCRGLVLNLKDKKVVCLPPAKFFNLSESQCPISEKELLEMDKISIDEKVDGSGLLVFRNEGEWDAITLGSFNSDQAKLAKTWINKKWFAPRGYESMMNYSFFMEIIYPENRIICDYEGYHGFISLCSYDNYSGEYGYYNTSKLKSLGLIINKGTPIDLKKYEYSFDQLKNHLDSLSGNEEGFIIVTEDGRRAKLKGEKYLTLHRAKYLLTPLSTYEAMVEGKVEESRRLIPEEFLPTFDNYVMLLNSKIDVLKVEYEDVATQHEKLLPEKYSRKEFAIAASSFKKKYEYYIFARLFAYNDLNFKFNMKFKNKEFNHEPFSQEEQEVFDNSVNAFKYKCLLSLVRPESNVI